MPVVREVSYSIIIIIYVSRHLDYLQTLGVREPDTIRLVFYSACAIEE